MDDGEQGGSSENRRKKLLFRAQRRGFKEVDLIFGAWAERYLPGLDQAVYDWLRGAAIVPAEHDNEVFAGLKALCGRKDAPWNA